MAVTPVFAAVGVDVLGDVERLGLDRRLRLVATPRAAQVLLVAGRQRPADRLALARVHDQLPMPRRTIWWRTDPLPGFAVGSRAPDDIDACAHSIATATGEGEPALLADVPPNPWEGIGPHGQGGEGMMGGTPHGRPMAMTADDLRDGLALDAYTATFGPYLTAFPAGLALTLGLQGDVIQSVTVAAAAHSQDAPATTPHLALARILRLLELPALAERLVRCAVTPDRPAAGLARAIRWSGALAAVPPGLGVAADGTDVRARVRGWLDALKEGRPNPPDPAPVDLSGLLPGLEWQEAMLVIASFGIERLGGGTPAYAAPGPRAAA